MHAQQEQNLLEAAGADRARKARRDFVLEIPPGSCFTTSGTKAKNHDGEATIALSGRPDPNHARMGASTGTVFILPRHQIRYKLVSDGG